MMIWSARSLAGLAAAGALWLACAHPPRGRQLAAEAPASGANDASDGATSAAGAELETRSRGYEPELLPGGAPWVAGRQKDEIWRVIRAHEPAALACYEERLAKTPRATGTISIRLVISASGQPVQASIHRSTFADPVMEDCLLQVARGWNFPAKAREENGVAVVVVPLLFKLWPPPEAFE